MGHHLPMASATPAYRGFIPPCGVYCGSCPSYTRSRNACPGAEVHCRQRRCKSIYVCCVERKKLRFCHECRSYPCARFRRFAETWERCGQNLHWNQEQLRLSGASQWLAMMTSRSAEDGGQGVVDGRVTT